LRGTNLSEETTINLYDDWSAILEVVYEGDLAAIHLTDVEVARLWAFLRDAFSADEEEQRERDGRRGN
jgi:hypothetical protein